MAWMACSARIASEERACVASGGLGRGGRGAPQVSRVRTRTRRISTKSTPKCTRACFASEGRIRTAQRVAPYVTDPPTRKEGAAQSTGRSTARGRSTQERRCGWRTRGSAGGAARSKGYAEVTTARNRAGRLSVTRTARASSGSADANVRDPCARGRRSESEVGRGRREGATKGSTAMEGTRSGCPKCAANIGIRLRGAEGERARSRLAVVEERGDEPRRAEAEQDVEHVGAQHVAHRHVALRACVATWQGR
eukprot:4425265-Pleurochrysis_carterae.AAC.3